jgi:hypothetical protein
MSTVAKLTLIEIPTQQPKAWYINIKDQGKHWVPYSCIKSYLPATKEITIQTWILREKGIKYKTK